MTQNKNVAVIGAGSWGTALCKILMDNGCYPNWWVRKPDVVKHVNDFGNNPDYLSAVHFAKDKMGIISDDINEVCRTASALIFAVPSSYAKEVIDSIDPDVLKRVVFISATKGLLPTNELIHQYLGNQYGFDVNNYIAIAGPCHAEEVAAEHLSYLTFACSNAATAQAYAQWFNTHYLKTVISTDIAGAQLAAVMKNIYAVGAGISDGLGYGDNFQSVYVTNCFREMVHVLSNNVPSFQQCSAQLNSAYLGDLLVTCYSLHSRNRRLGNMLAKGYDVATAGLYMNMVAEGYYAAAAMVTYFRLTKEDAPILYSLYDIMYKKVPARQAFDFIQKKLQ
jgi:glycerol-3-phosphate dehydrogenase (NAD(P)+)